MNPPQLSLGDTILIVATAKKLAPAEIDPAIALLRAEGFVVECGPHLYEQAGAFAGTDAQRLADLQWALDHPTAKAVVFARGGYGTARLMPHLNWTKFRAKPKWLCGFSDLTMLHAAANQLDVSTLHSTMPIYFKNGEHTAGSYALLKALRGAGLKMHWQSQEHNRPGIARAQLIGGNLSVLITTLGTADEPDFSGKILLLEDVGEHHYRIDRMLVHLRQTGALSQLSGLVVGQFTEMADSAESFGRSVAEIIREAVADFHYPVAFNAPIGHTATSLCVPLGAELNLTVTATAAELSNS